MVTALGLKHECSTQQKCTWFSIRETDRVMVLNKRWDDKQVTVRQKKKTWEVSGTVATKIET